MLKRRVVTSPLLPAFAPTLDEAERATAAYAFEPAEPDVEELQARHQVQLAHAWQAAEQGRRACHASLADLGHDLRTPLNAIIGYSERLIDDASDEAAADLRLILASGERLRGMLDHVLDWSRAQARKLVFEPGEFDVCETLAELANAIAPLAARHGNAVHVVAQPMGNIRADAPKIRQILFTLLENACKYTQRGNITVRAWRDGMAQLRLEVIDDGIGLDPAASREIFKGLDRTSGGDGLGLASCRKLCQIMGGTIAVRSATGAGTTFTVLLPITNAD